MLWTDTSEGTFLANNGGVMLAEQTSFSSLRSVVESQGYLAVSVPAPSPAHRSNLSLVIEEAIEVCLEALGAVAPGVGASVDIDASISDQLYRARLLERRGIVLFLPNLEGMANLEGTLDGEDSVALSWWMQATQERPLGLVIDTNNRYLRVYPAPVPFESLLRASTYPPPAPATAPEQASSSETMDLSAPPLPVILEPSELQLAEESPNLARAEPLRVDGDPEQASEPELAEAPHHQQHFSEPEMAARRVEAESHDQSLATESDTAELELPGTSPVQRGTASLHIHWASDVQTASAADENLPGDSEAHATDAAVFETPPAAANATEDTRLTSPKPETDPGEPLAAHKTVSVDAEAVELPAQGASATELAANEVDNVHDALTIKAEPPPDVLEAVRQVRQATSDSSDASATGERQEREARTPAAKAGAAEANTVADDKLADDKLADDKLADDKLADDKLAVLESTKVEAVGD